MTKKIDHKPLPLGISDYKKMVLGNYYYVDKTLLIHQTLQAAEVILMPRPRRFGKTINLSMMRYFFEKSTPNEPIDHEALFANSKLLNQHPDYRNIMGKYPVIFLTFKRVAQSSWQNTYKNFQLLICREFKRHYYLFDSITFPGDKELFLRLCQGQAEYSELTSSLLFLSKLLYDFYNQKIIVLLDEYDAPLHEAYTHNYFPEAINFVRKLLSDVFKDNNFLHKGFITGILSIGKESIFSGLNNVIVYNVTKDRTADCFGFTQDEVKVLLDDYDMSNHLPAIKSWYDGYRFGDQKNIYNPWSVLHCVEFKGALEPYWVNTSQDELIKKLLAKAPGKFKTDFETLLAGNEIKISIEQSITMTELDNDARGGLLWSLLLYAGYLTFSSISTIDETIRYNLCVPNTELKRLLKNLIAQIFDKTFKPEALQRFIEALINGDREELTLLLQSFIAKTISIFDIPKDETERSYHLFVLGLLVGLQETYDVKSNRESGAGRYDVMLIPKDKSQTPIIIEFKKSLTQTGLSKAALAALTQIKEKNYTQELQDRGFSNHRAYGMAFHGKEVFVAMEA